MSTDLKTPVPLRPVETVEAYRESRRQRTARLKELRDAGDMTYVTYSRFAVGFVLLMAIVMAAPDTQHWVVTAASLVVWFIGLGAMAQAEEILHKHTFVRNIAGLVVRFAVFAALVLLLPQQTPFELSAQFYAVFGAALVAELCSWVIHIRHYEYLTGFTWKKSRAAAPVDLEKTSS